MTIEQKIFDVLYDSKLAWSAVKEPLFSKDQEPTSAYGIFRSDSRENIGVVGSKYQPLQNQQLVQEFIESTKEFGLTELEGSSVNGGKKVVIKAKVGSIQIGKDLVHRYITVSNTHDGSSQVKLGIFNRVLVCSNGMMREVTSHELAKVKHTTNAGEKMNWYIRNIPVVLKMEEEMMRNYQMLSEVKVNSKHIQTLIDNIYGVDSTLPVDEISTRKQNQVKEFDKVLTTNGLNVHGDTLWGALQAMTYIQSHTPTGIVSEKYMTGASYEKSNMTYELLMSMIGNPIYDEVEVIA